MSFLRNYPLIHVLTVVLLPVLHGLWRLYLHIHCRRECWGRIMDMAEESEERDAKGVKTGRMIYCWIVLYRVDGITYANTDRIISRSKSEADARLTEYGGMKIPVRYDTRKPYHGIVQDPVAAAEPIAPGDDLPENRRVTEEEARRVLAEKAEAAPRIRWGLFRLKRTVARASASCRGEFEGVEAGRKPYWVIALPVLCVVSFLIWPMYTNKNDALGWLRTITFLVSVPAAYISLVRVPADRCAVSYRVGKYNYRHLTKIGRYPRMNRDNVWLMLDACRGEEITVHYDPDNPRRAWCRLPVRRWTDDCLDMWAGPEKTAESPETVAR